MYIVTFTLKGYHSPYQV